MRKWIFAATVIAISSVGIANAAKIKSYADFFAPSVHDKSNYTNTTSVGAIVYDTSDNNFYGKDASNAWNQLGGGGSSSALGFVGSILYSNAIGWNNSNNGYQSFSPISVGSPVISQGIGTCSQPSTGIPAITCSIPAGTYRVEAYGWFESGTGGQEAAFNFFDGTNNAVGENGIFPINAGSAFGVMPHIAGFFTYSSPQTNVTFQIRAGGIGANAAMIVGALKTSTLIRVVREL